MRKIIKGLSYQMDTQHNQESLFTTGNGRFGLRGTYDEKMPYESRGFFCAGFFGTEKRKPESLVNLADPSQMRIKINDNWFHLLESNIVSHQRYINTQTFELIREIEFRDDQENRYRLSFKRLFSHVDPTIFYQKLDIISLDSDVNCAVEIGIDGDQQGSGFSLLEKVKKTVYKQTYMSARYQYIHSVYKCMNYVMGLRECDEWMKGTFRSTERGVFGFFCTTLKKGITRSFVKTCIISHLDYDDQYYIQKLKYANAYDAVTELHLKKKNSELGLISINSTNDIAEKINGSIYHTDIMTPVDGNVSIGAKGLSGEGYLGHVFWDTEIFMLPTYLFTAPEKAKQLLEYRYQRLNEAKLHAMRNGYEGAQVPWESASSGDDQTPTHTAFNIFTGKQNKIYSGLKEIHVTADIMYAILLYYQYTEDEKFMQEMGSKMLEQYSKFWISRLKKTTRGYEILDVIGPDEYTEHVNNNYYTNYLVKMCLKNSVKWLSDIKLISQIKVIEPKIFLPDVNNKLIPQDDTFLDKKIIDIKCYQMHAGSQSILNDYSREEVIEMQILKQADLIMLFELFPFDFDIDVKKRTYDYYDEKTIHDSSLSKATHSIVAYDLLKIEKANQYFLDALDIDFSVDSHSKMGIHAAAMYRPFQILIKGIIGFKVSQEDEVEITPKKQQLIDSFHVKFQFKRRILEVKYHMDFVEINLLSGDSLEFIYQNQKIKLKDTIILENLNTDKNEC